MGAGMCDECDKLDACKLVNPATDPFAQAMVAVMIKDLEAEKAKLHPQEEKK
jgi:hypothetical protein